MAATDRRVRRLRDPFGLARRGLSAHWRAAAPDPNGRAHRYQWPVSAGRAAAHHPDPLNEPPVSEILPGLYRAVLDAVAALEARHRRREAAEIRAEATRVYSRAWTPDAARRLRILKTRADRSASPRARTRYETVVETIGRPVDLERKTA
jgi:hypothetical protein